MNQHLNLGLLLRILLGILFFQFRKADDKCPNSSCSCSVEALLNIFFPEEGTKSVCVPNSCGNCENANGVKKPVLVVCEKKKENQKCGILNLRCVKVAKDSYVCVPDNEKCLEDVKKCAAN